MGGDILIRSGSIAISEDCCCTTLAPTTLAPTSGYPGTTLAPTTTHQQAYQIASDQFTALRLRLQRIVDEDQVTLEQDMDKLGVPWTPGREIPQGN